MKRGEVVHVDFPFSDGSDSKVRPALIVQSDALKIRDIIIAAISSSPSEVCVPITPDGKNGVDRACYVQCDKLFTISRTTIYGAVGRLSKATMRETDACIRNVLDL